MLNAFEGKQVDLNCPVSMPEEINSKAHDEHYFITFNLNIKYLNGIKHNFNPTIRIMILAKQTLALMAFLRH